MGGWGVQSPKQKKFFQLIGERAIMEEENCSWVYKVYMQLRNIKQVFVESVLVYKFIMAPPIHMGRLHKQIHTAFYVCFYVVFMSWNNLTFYDCHPICSYNSMNSDSFIFLIVHVFYFDVIF